MATISSAAIVGAVFAVIVAALAGYVYTFGIPPQMKRAMEEKALETMGENKASYMMKDAVGKIPANDQQEIKDFKKGLGNTLGGTFQNPLGKEAGNAGDELTRDFTGR